MFEESSQLPTLDKVLLHTNNVAENHEHIASCNGGGGGGGGGGRGGGGGGFPGEIMQIIMDKTMRFVD